MVFFSTCQSRNNQASILGKEEVACDLFLQDNRNIQPHAEGRMESFSYLLAWRVFQQRHLYDYVSFVWDGEHGARMNFITVLSWRSRAGIFLEALVGRRSTRTLSKFHFQK
jgi:hypothetical protein